MKLYKAIRRFQTNVYNNINTLLLAETKRGRETFTASRELAIATRDTFTEDTTGESELSYKHYFGIKAIKLCTLRLDRRYNMKQNIIILKHY